jgi:hypothetical protein
VLWAYFIRDSYVFAALVAVGVFGLFNETTNSPYVALIFFLLMNFASHAGQEAGDAYAQSRA